MSCKQYLPVCYYVVSSTSYIFLFKKNNFKKLICLMSKFKLEHKLATLNFPPTTAELALNLIFSSIDNHSYSYEISTVTTRP